MNIGKQEMIVLLARRIRNGSKLNKVKNEEEAVEVIAQFLVESEMVTAATMFPETQPGVREV